MLTLSDVILYSTVFFGLFTSIFFILTLVDGVPRRRRPRLKRYGTVCIIIPCYNEERTVARTIESVLRLDYPRKKLDILVVDDGSTDKTFAIAKQYEKRGVRVFRKRNGGKYTALNYGLARTRAAFVCGLDADSHVDPRALKRMLPHFLDPRVMAVTPSMKIHEPKKGLQRVQWTEFILGIFLRYVFTMLGSQHVTPGPFSIYRKAFFDSYGPYRQAHHTEDIEVALRIQSHNYEIENANDAYVYTHGPATFRGLWNQRLRWYYGFLRNIEDYRHLFGRKHGILGLLILPGAMLSIAFAVIGVMLWLFRMSTAWWDKYVQLSAIGWDIQWEFSFDTFFLNMDSVAILGIIALLTGILLILLAKWIAGERQSLVMHYVWFIALYWLLYGAWWIAALLARVSGRKITWRHKSQT